MRDRLTQYIRQNGKPIGCVVALKLPEGVSFGWAVQRSKKEPQFRRKFCVGVATDRALLGVTHPVPNRTEKRIVEDSVVEINVVSETLNRMKARAEKYFNNPKFAQMA